MNIMNNQIKTVVLLTLLSVIFIYAGKAMGGQQGMVIAFIFALLMNFGSYWFSSKIVLALYRATPISEDHDVYQLVREIATAARMPMPKVYRIPSMSPNAFATGRNPQHGVIAVSEGLLRILNTEELKGVLAHEMSHIVNRDTFISAVVATIASSIVMLANMAKWAAIFGGHRRNESGRGSGALELLAMAIVAPIAATLIQLAISRSREFQADRRGAEIARNPYGLITALQKISQAAHDIPLEHATPAPSHLFIVNPLSWTSLTKLFSTHPPLEERIERLRNLRSYAR